jgi:hypothetical protein
MDKLKTIFRPTITIKDIGTLYIPTVDDVIEISEDKYNELLMPYLTSMDMFIMPEEYKNQLKTFDLLYIPNSEGKLILHYNEKSMLELLMESLKFFFKTDVQHTKDYPIIVVGDLGIVTRDNFDMLSDLILEVNQARKPETEKMPEFKDEKHRISYMKLMEGRRKSQQKDKISLLFFHC